MKQNGFTDKLKETSPVPERISPENIEKKLYEQKRSRISIRRRAVSAAAAVAVVAGGTAGYLYKGGYFDKEFTPKTAEIQYEDTAKNRADSSNDSSSSDTPISDDTQQKTYELKGLKSLSYDELDDYIKENYNYKTYFGDEEVFYGDMNVAEMAEEADGDVYTSKNAAAKGAVDDEASGTKEHSETYRQEEGVDEADIVKTDGKNIYYLSEGHVFAIECDNGKMEEHMIDFKELFGDEYKLSFAREMYLDGGSLTVIADSSNAYDYTCWKDSNMDDYVNETRYQPTVNVITFDVTDLDNIKETGKYTMQGNYISSRMVDGKLYLTSSCALSYFGTYEKGGIPEFAPVYEVNGEKHYVSSGDIFVSDSPENIWGYTNLSLVDTRKECRPAGIKTFLGYSSEIYQTADRLFLISNFYDYQSDSQNVRLISIDTENGTLEPLSSGKLKGNVKDKYSLSYRDGVLSVVTNESRYDNETYEMLYNNYLYNLDEQLDILGRTESFGDGEVVKSVTYNDGYAYVVTFMQTDPLFAIDLHDPKNPTVVSELKMPGFSSHMRPFTEGRIVGFGNTADEDTGRTTGLKLSIYDSSDPNNVKELDKVEMKELDTRDKTVYISSAAEYDEKALLIDAEKNIIAFPYYVSEHDSRSFHTLSNKSGYRFYSYSDEEGLTLKGEYKIVKYYSEDEDYYGLYNSFVRAAYIGDVYYLFYDCGIVSVDMNTFEEIDNINLAELFKDDEEWVRYYGIDDEFLVFN